MTSITLFVEDNGHYPLANQKGEGNDNKFYISWGDALAMGGYDGRTMSYDEAYKAEAYEPFSLYECPTMTSQWEEARDKLYPGQTYTHLRSYAMNSAKIINQEEYKEYGGGITTEKSATGRTVAPYEVEIPSETILLAEIYTELGNGYHKAGVIAPQQLQSQIDQPETKKTVFHDYQTNWLFCDGHVELLLPDETRDTKPGRNIWIPGKYWTIGAGD
jgi:prepilin-type processing-associated H-X9-DG protein